MHPILANKADRQTSLINSSGMFLLAFVILYFSNLLITWGIAELFGIDARLYYYKVEYLINNTSSLWSEDSIILIFFAGPFFSLFVAALAARLHFLFRPEPGTFKVFLLYLYLHGMNFTFSSILAGALSEEVFWYGMIWMRIPKIIMYLLGLIGLGMLLLTSNAKSVFFIEASHYPNANNKTNRQSWLLNTVLYPWVISSLIGGLILLPEILLYYVIFMATMLIMIIPVFRKSQLVNDVMNFDNGNSPGIQWVYWFVAIALLVAFRLIFN